MSVSGDTRVNKPSEGFDSLDDQEHYGAILGSDSERAKPMRYVKTGNHGEVGHNW